MIQFLFFQNNVQNILYKYDLVPLRQKNITYTNGYPFMNNHFFEKSNKKENVNIIYILGLYFI